VENIPMQLKAVFPLLTTFGRQKMAVVAEEKRI
jgi:hypothetical protein